MRAIKYFAAGLLLLVGASASAQLITRGSSFGANSVIVDSFTGLSWLQLPHSTGLTEADWIGAAENSRWNDDYTPHPTKREWTFQSGAYAGYSVATSADFSALVQRQLGCAGATTCSGFRWSDGNWPTDPLVTNRLLDLIGLFGGDLTATSDGGRHGFLSGTVLVEGYPYGDDIWVEAGSGPSGYWTQSDRYSGRSGMTFLIGPVPEPSTYALMLAGLGLVAFVARRRRQVAQGA